MCISKEYIWSSYKYKEHISEEGAGGQTLRGTDIGQSIYVNYVEMGINRRPAVHCRVTSEPTIK